MLNFIVLSVEAVIDNDEFKVFEYLVRYAAGRSTLGSLLVIYAFDDRSKWI